MVGLVFGLHRVYSCPSELRGKDLSTLVLALVGSYARKQRIRINRMKNPIVTEHPIIRWVSP